MPPPGVTALGRSDLQMDVSLPINPNPFMSIIISVCVCVCVGGGGGEDDYYLDKPTTSKLPLCCET